MNPNPSNIIRLGNPPACRVVGQNVPARRITLSFVECKRRRPAEHSDPQGDAVFGLVCICSADLGGAAR